jgi:hypothetical protein
MSDETPKQLTPIQSAREALKRIRIDPYCDTILRCAQEVYEIQARCNEAYGKEVPASWHEAPTQDRETCVEFVLDLAKSNFAFTPPLVSEMCDEYTYASYVACYLKVVEHLQWN